MKTRTCQARMSRRVLCSTHVILQIRQKLCVQNNLTNANKCAFFRGGGGSPKSFLNKNGKR